MFRRTPFLAAIVVGLLAIGSASADVIPVSSQLALSANAQIDDGPLVELQPTVSQGATLNPLSVSVDNALTYPAGTLPLLVGADCNPSASVFCVSVDGQESATWTSASQGTVTFSNYGWHDHLSTIGSIPPNGGDSTLVPNSLPFTQFDYSFVADISGTMDIYYTVAFSGTDCFGLQPFQVIASGGTGGPEGSAGPTGNTCGTTSGDISGPITAGDPYNFFITNESNLGGGLGDRTALIDATFDFTIPSSSTAPVPESSSVILLVTVVAMLGFLPRRKLLVRVHPGEPRTQLR
jgi:hypothetical protein